MQIKNITLNKRQITYLLKVILTLVSISFILNSINKNEVKLSALSLPSDATTLLFLVGLLMVVNWGLEAKRWQISVSIYEPITFYDSLNQVLSGLSLNWVFPFTAGDAMARLMPMREKVKTLAAMALNRGIMLSLTLLSGLIGAYHLIQFEFSHLLLWLCVILIIFLAAGYWNKDFRKNYIELIEYYKSLNKKLSLSIVILSTIRFAVFILQFLIMFKLFLPDLNSVVILGGIGWIFFTRSIFPTLFGGLGVREASGVLYFSPFVADISLIILPIFIIWIINIVIPSFFGLIPLLKIKSEGNNYVSLRQ